MNYNSQSNPQMEENKKFLSELRQEIFQTQVRRSKLLITKLSFISSFFGIGFIDELSNQNLSPVLYAIPIIALIFDLYLMGESYSIIRAATFLRNHNSTSEAEKEWEGYVGARRDYFSSFAYIITSILIVTFCIVILQTKQKPPSSWYNLWLIVCGFYIFTQTVYPLFVLLFHRKR